MLYIYPSILQIQFLFLTSFSIPSVRQTSVREGVISKS